MTWRARLEARIAGQAAQPREITVSRTVFERAKTHDLHIVRSTTTHTIARVRSSKTGNVYKAELWVDEDRFYPTFPYIWKCSCKWARERFLPCSHVLAVALYRGRTYDTESSPKPNREGSSRDH